MQNEDFARELYARWEAFFSANVERIADELLSKYDQAGYIVEIDRLVVDLESISEADFDEHFPLRFREKLEEALLQELQGLEYPHNPQPSDTTRKIPQHTYRFDLLTYFLLHGRLFWNASVEYKDIRRLFLRVVQESGEQLKQFLLTYGHYTSLRERLVYQLGDAELEKGIELLAPAQATFICAYVRLLILKYDKIEQPPLKQADFRSAVWLIVYTYLLDNRGSCFDKKSFLAQTILQLAARNNLSYDALLRIITAELETFYKSLLIPDDLFRMLEELRVE